MISSTWQKQLIVLIAVVVTLVSGQVELNETESTPTSNSELVSTLQFGTTLTFQYLEQNPEDIDGALQILAGVMASPLQTVIATFLQDPQGDFQAVANAIGLDVASGLSVIPSTSDYGNLDVDSIRAEITLMVQQVLSETTTESEVVAVEVEVINAVISSIGNALAEISGGEFTFQVSVETLEEVTTVANQLAIQLVNEQAEEDADTDADEETPEATSEENTEVEASASVPPIDISVIADLESGDAPAVIQYIEEMLVEEQEDAVVNLILYATNDTQLSQSMVTVMENIFAGTDIPVQQFIDVLGIAYERNTIVAMILGQAMLLAENVNQMEGLVSILAIVLTLPSPSQDAFVVALEYAIQQQGCEGVQDILLQTSTAITQQNQSNLLEKAISNNNFISACFQEAESNQVVSKIVNAIGVSNIDEAFELIATANTGIQTDRAIAAFMLALQEGYQSQLVLLLAQYLKSEDISVEMKSNLVFQFIQSAGEEAIDILIDSMVEDESSNQVLEDLFLFALVVAEKNVTDVFVQLIQGSIIGNECRLKTIVANVLERTSAQQGSDILSLLTLGEAQSCLPIISEPEVAEEPQTVLLTEDGELISELYEDEQEDEVPVEPSPIPAEVVEQSPEFQLTEDGELIEEPVEVQEEQEEETAPIPPVVEEQAPEPVLPANGDITAPEEQPVPVTAPVVAPAVVAAPVGSPVLLDEDGELLYNPDELPSQPVSVTNAALQQPVPIVEDDKDEELKSLTSQVQQDELPVSLDPQPIVADEEEEDEEEIPEAPVEVPVPVPEPMIEEEIVPMEMPVSTTTQQTQDEEEEIPRRQPVVITAAQQTQEEVVPTPATPQQQATQDAVDSLVQIPPRPSPAILEEEEEEQEQTGPTRRSQVLAQQQQVYEDEVTQQSTVTRAPAVTSLAPGFDPTAPAGAVLGATQTVDMEEAVESEPEPELDVATPTVDDDVQTGVTSEGVASEQVSDIASTPEPVAEDLDKVVATPYTTAIVNGQVVYLNEDGELIQDPYEDEEEEEEDVPVEPTLTPQQSVEPVEPTVQLDEDGELLVPEPTLTPQQSVEPVEPAVQLDEDGELLVPEPTPTPIKAEAVPTEVEEEEIEVPEEEPEDVPTEIPTDPDTLFQNIVMGITTLSPLVSSTPTASSPATTTATPTTSSTTSTTASTVTSSTVSEEQVSDDGGECVDVPPPGGLTCSQQARFGKCERDWMKSENYCALTCGYCGDSVGVVKVCTDIAPQGDYSCEEQKKFGKCTEGWMISGGYCQETCGLCESDSDTSDEASAVQPVQAAASSTVSTPSTLDTSTATVLPVQTSSSSTVSTPSTLISSTTTVLPTLTSSSSTVSTSSISGTSTGEDCVDIQPNDEFTCEEQEKFGKCEEAWMKQGGFCEVTCGTCPSVAN